MSIKKKLISKAKTVSDKTETKQNNFDFTKKNMGALHNMDR